MGSRTFNGRCSYVSHYQRVMIWDGSTPIILIILMHLSSGRRNIYSQAIFRISLVQTLFLMAQRATLCIILAKPRFSSATLWRSNHDFSRFFLWFRYFLHTLWQGPDRFKCNVFNYDDHWSSSSPYLVGGLEHDFYFPIEWECHHPNWLSYFSEGFFNHQPASIDYP